MTVKKFKHIGGRGDIIFGLPTMMLLGGGDLYITGDFVTNLLEIQPYINKVYMIHPEEFFKLEVDYDLSKFKEQDVAKYGILRAHLDAFNLDVFGVDTSGSHWDLSKPWLFGIHPKPTVEIIINDTGTARWPGFTVNWDALKPYESKCGFIGWDTEYEEFKKARSLNVKRIPVRHALEFARVIKGSKLYIGNQSLGWAIAEGLKCPRVIDSTYGMIQEYPQSQNGHTELTCDIIEKYLGQWRPKHPDSPYI